MPRGDPHHRQRDHPAQGARGRCPLRPDRLAGTEDPAAQGPQPRLIDLGTQRKCLGAPSGAAKILLTWGFAVQAQMTTLQLPRSDLPAGSTRCWPRSPPPGSGAITGCSTRPRSPLTSVRHPTGAAGDLAGPGPPCQREPVLDVLRFLGRKLRPALKAAVVTQAKRRPEGWATSSSWRSNAAGGT